MPRRAKPDNPKREPTPAERAESERRRRERDLARCYSHMLRRMPQWRASEAALHEENLGSCHVKRNTYDQWELHYLCSHKCKTPPYEARSLTQYVEGR